MAVKIRMPYNVAGPGSHSLLRRLVAVAVLLVVAGLLVFGIVFGYYYHKYRAIVDDRLSKPLFANTAKIYAAPREIRPGQKLSVRAIAQQLRDAGYSEDASGNGGSGLGTYSENAEAITIHPGPQSYHAPESATITFEGSSVSQITGQNGAQLAAYELEPQLITGLSDQSRTKRRLITYDQLPKYLVPAVTSIEDRRFFSHGGVDYIRVLGALRNDLLHRHAYMEGASTLTMQLARGFFLTPEKHLKRKLIEAVITYQLEHRFTKQQIFEMYANQIPLGQQGSFAINGFGEAAEVFFGKDVRQLNLDECALLAGMIQSPSRLNPYRHLQRALDRRNLVLDTMAESGEISKAEAEEAKARPIHLAAPSVEQNEAPYFVDLVRDQLNAKLGDAAWNTQGLRIYTSLDPQLQAAATTAVEIGMKSVDAQVDRLHKTGAEVTTYPQVALVALNPHTGQILALVGGRNYGTSQLNHAIAHRPTGSIFKPFVYAAAFNSSLSGTQITGPDGTSALFTPATLLQDQQQTFEFGNGQQYTPRNFKGEYHDEVTARYALQHSLNNATISLASMVGYGNVASLARDAGIKSARATPAVALGAYDATPIDMAGAYTVFANNGVKIDPWMLASVRASNGDPVTDYTSTTKPVLDPRVAYLTTSLMENVMNAGTAAVVRAMGFTAPAAGKTGTSHDAWFAGYTSNLLCIVWVGNDDYSDVKIEGAHAAAPIWAEFMKRAVALPQYSDTKEFTAPPGVISVQLDKATNLLADSTCPDNTYTAVFLEGTQPLDTCSHSNGDQRNLFQKIFGTGPSQPVPPQGQASPDQPQRSADYGVVGGSQTPAQQQQPAPVPAPAKKQGFFGKLFGHKDKPDQPAPAPGTPQ
jgi:penicillin-binding protein 1B